MSGAAEAVPLLLPLAAGVALSPFPVVAAAMVLAGPRAATAGPAFVVGWVAGLALLSAAAMAVLDQAGSATGTIASLLRLGIGLGLLAAAAGKWRGRPRDGERPPVPGWIAAIDGVGPGRALGVGAALGGLNPKNLAFAAAAASSIAGLGLEGREAVLAGLIFVGLGSTSVLAALSLRLAGGERAAKRLDAVKAFMIDNAAVVLMVVFVILGVKLVGEGLAGLAG